MFRGKLLSHGTNAKTVKSDAGDSGYLTAILYLAPADTVEGVNLCPAAKLAGCREACLYSAGRGSFTNVQAARIRKTVLWRDDRAEFMRQLGEDLERFIKYCERRGMKPAVRLNGTSDIAWEDQVAVRRHGDEWVRYGDVFGAYPEIQFYDYTKTWTRIETCQGIANYHLSLSYSEASPKYAKRVWEVAERTNCNLVGVCRGKTLPGSVRPGKYGKFPRIVVDGDKTDLRFLDGERRFTLVRAKGAAKRDRSGFVLDL